jgi:hypothetical protein
LHTNQVTPWRKASSRSSRRSEEVSTTTGRSGGLLGADAAEQPQAGHPRHLHVGSRQQPPRAVGGDDRVHHGLGDGLEALLGGGQGLR